MPSAKYVPAPEIFEHCRRIAETFDLYRERAVLHRGHRARVGRRLRALDHPHRPRRRDPRPVRGDGNGSAQPAQAAWYPRNRDLCRRTRSTPAAGTTTYTGGDWTRRADDGLADKRVGIIGTGATAVQCIPPLARDARRAVRVPTHAVVGRRPQQPSDRPRMVRDARARLAEEVAAELRDPADRRLRRRGPRERRLDRYLATHPRPHRREGRRRQRADARARRPRIPRERRREDGGDPRSLRRRGRGRARPRST